MTTTPVRPPRTDGALHRTAGWGALGAAVAYLGQPLAVALLFSEYPDDAPVADRIAAAPWNGAVEGVIFGGLGLGMLVLVLAVGRLRGGASVAGRVGDALGLVSAAAWILIGGMSLAKYSSVTAGMGEDLPGAQDQLAVITALDTVIIGLVATAGIGAAGWLVGLATAGRRVGVVGTGLAVVCAVAAAVIVVPMFVLAVPFGVLVLIPVLLVLGAAFLLRGRRTTADRVRTG
ncbi:hypothetical protein [Pseudonocardia abyssalis]|uniref:DUF4386 family protein n=1 Tax=Pseudonocardia abyssalis TaxID=2792008 RepID=A0ABS6UZ52_9PSEU|nr:hypothetical protein [Pseudonocardia abyssalis]MBW0117759.1 hypothetical protein [Pseudonocardia abyssalis]MBW0137545.1 hypothetical protein [Pseudonocardia abyssalis]